MEQSVLTASTGDVTFDCAPRTTENEAAKILATCKAPSDFEEQNNFMYNVIVF